MLVAQRMRRYLGSRLDYDGWAALGNPGWSTDELRPLFHAASERLRVRIPSAEEITPYQRESLDAAVAAGILRVADLNDLDENLGMAPSPANIVTASAGTPPSPISTPSVSDRT